METVYLSCGLLLEADVSNGNRESAGVCVGVSQLRSQSGQRLLVLVTTPLNFSSEMSSRAELQTLSERVAARLKLKRLVRRGVRVQ